MRTDLYQAFEASIVRAFADQVRLTSHRVQFDFRTFDPLNFYKTLQPILIEHAEAKSPAEVGSGMRNLIVMALFRAYASVLRRGAIIAVEEPEI
ncbi:ATP-binding protein [Microvirga sp. Mcv34]|uniref:ATP-binding protein n=1 Tax=Microvirga sp. Mcv34 TaxID=2926016 RepID=UPI0021C90A72|nr:ATP-binding protein [Microvirga sp. Mcv34]